MGTSLTGLTPATTYDALIKTGDNEPISGTLKVLSDGLGNNLPIEASTTTINFTNQLQQSGVAVPTASEVAAKQDTLVSGTNIKTINSTSILGSGNISVAPASGINATAIGTGVVDNTEFGYLNGVTSSIQTQLDAKSSTITGGASTIVTTDLTASRAVISNGLGKVDVSAVTSTELGFVSGVTSAIQTQINAKQDTLVSGTNIKTINSTSLLGSGNITIAANPSGVAGAIQFSDGSAFSSDATKFFWDNTNKRLGIGTNSPAALIDTYLAGTLTGNYMLGKFAFQTGGNNRNVYIKIGGGSSLFDLNVEAGNPYYELRYGNSATTLGTGIAQRVRYDGATAIPKQLIVGSETVQTTNMLQIKGSGSTSATTSLLVQNSAGGNSLQVYDDQNASFGANMNLTSSASPNINIGTGGYPSLKLNNRVAIQEDSSTTVNFGTNYSILTFLLSNSEQARFNTTGFILGGTTNNASAKLQVDSTTQGVLFPRMTTTQKNAIATPASGLVVYDSTTNKLCCYNGSTWNDLF